MKCWSRAWIYYAIPAAIIAIVAIASKQPILPVIAVLFIYSALLALVFRYVLNYNVAEGGIYVPRLFLWMCSYGSGFIFFGSDPSGRDFDIFSVLGSYSSLFRPISLSSITSVEIAILPGDRMPSRLDKDGGYFNAYMHMGPLKGEKAVVLHGRAKTAGGKEIDANYYLIPEDAEGLLEAIRARNEVKK
jgi:hypothetical protein